MLQVVNPESGADAGPAVRGQEDGASPVRQPQHAPGWHREHQVVRFLARHGLSDLAGQEPGSGRCGTGATSGCPRRCGRRHRRRPAEHRSCGGPGRYRGRVRRLPRPSAGPCNRAARTKTRHGPVAAADWCELIVGQEDVVTSLDCGRPRPRAGQRGSARCAPVMVQRLRRRRMPTSSIRHGDRVRRGRRSRLRLSGSATASSRPRRRCAITSLILTRHPLAGSGACENDNQTSKTPMADRGQLRAPRRPLPR